MTGIIFTDNAWNHSFVLIESVLPSNGTAANERRVPGSRSLSLTVVCTQKLCQQSIQAELASD
jgi:hypothetical protein